MKSLFILSMYAMTKFDVVYVILSKHSENG